MSESTPRIKVSRTRRRLYHITPDNPSTEQAEDAPVTSAEAALEARMQRQLKQQRARAHEMLHYHTALTGTVGALPLPLLDMVAVSALQLHLIRDLSRIYGVDFSSQRAKAAVAALLSGAQTGLVVSSMFKYVPVVGYIVASIPSAAAVGGITYAVGKVFIYHFELGGTLLDFDADKLRAYFKTQLKR